MGSSKVDFCTVEWEKERIQMGTGPDESLVGEMEEKLRARPDLVARLKDGDTTALAEILEYCTGTTVGSLNVRLLA